MPLASLAAAVFAVFLKGNDVFVLNLTAAPRAQEIEICGQPNRNRYPLELPDSPRDLSERLEDSEYFVVGYLPATAQQGETIYISVDPGRRFPDVEDVLKVFGEIADFSQPRLSTAPGGSSQGNPPVGTYPGSPVGNSTVDPGIRPPVDSGVTAPVDPDVPPPVNPPRDFFAPLRNLFGIKPRGRDADRFRAMFTRLQLKSQTVPKDLKDIRNPAPAGYELLVSSKTLRQDGVGRLGFALYSGFPIKADDGTSCRRQVNDAPKQSLFRDGVISTRVVQMQTQLQPVQYTYPRVQFGSYPRTVGGVTCYAPPCPWP